MLHVICKSHRNHLRAGTAEPQKVFTMLRLRPDGTLSPLRPPLAFVLLIDTSTSMRSYSGESKLDQAIAAAHALIDDPQLTPNDAIAIIGFDGDEHLVWPLSPVVDRLSAHQAIEGLRNFKGRTRMGRGLQCALGQLQNAHPNAARRVVLLTDGQTEDEPDCHRLSAQLAQMNAPLIAMGVGVSYNEELLRDMAEHATGRPYHLDAMEQWNMLLGIEMRASSREVLLDVTCQFGGVRGVTLDSCARVYPSLSALEMGPQGLRLGNLNADDDTVFLFEWSVGGWERPPVRARLAQLSLSGTACDGRPLQVPPQELILDFTRDEALTVQVDSEVLGYVQQKSLDRALQQAGREEGARASGSLQQALAMSKRLHNPSVTQIVENALSEVQKTGKLSPGTRKSVLLKPRTQTIKIGGNGAGGLVPDDEAIRRMTGA